MTPAHGNGRRQKWSRTGRNWLTVGKRGPARPTLGRRPYVVLIPTAGITASARSPGRGCSRTAPVVCAPAYEMTRNGKAGARPLVPRRRQVSRFVRANHAAPIVFCSLPRKHHALCAESCIARALDLSSSPSVLRSKIFAWALVSLSSFLTAALHACQKLAKKVTSIHIINIGRRRIGWLINERPRGKHNFGNK